MTTTDDDLGIPEFLDRTKDKTKEQMDAECRALNAKAATKQNEIRSPSAAMAQVPVNPLVEAQKLKRERSRVRIERRKAEKSGATKAMPLSGNEALRKIAKQATPSAAAESDALGTFPVDSIKVGERIRKDMGDIQGLAKSMEDLGLLCPILIKPDGTLLCGQRRLLAAKLLGWTTIPVLTVGGPAS